MNMQPSNFFESLGISVEDLRTQFLPENTPAPVITIVDKHPGSGKSTAMIEDLINSGKRRQIIVVPLLSEVMRVIDRSPVSIVMPIAQSSLSTDKKAATAYLEKEYPDGAPEGLYERLTYVPGGRPEKSKKDALQGLIKAGSHVVTTHALFSELGWLASEGLLYDYDIQIDEVLKVAEVATAITKVCKTADDRDGAFRACDKSKNGWRMLYVGDGYAEVDTDTGKLSATDKWRENADGLSGNLSKAMLTAIEAGRLYVDQAGLGGEIIMSELPVSLLKLCQSLKVYTYMAEGSFMSAYLRKHDIEFSVEKDEDLDAAFRKKASELITVNVCGRLSKQNFSFSAQDAIARRKKSVDDDNIVPAALTRMRRTDGELKGVDKSQIMVTSAKDVRFASGSKRKHPGKFAKGSRLSKDAQWVPNTTRGTNDYDTCSHLVYLWDQYANANVSRFLGVDDQHHRDMYAVSELIQWVYRSRVRKGQPITLFLPSQRMRRLLADWMDGKL